MLLVWCLAIRAFAEVWSFVVVPPGVLGNRFPWLHWIQIIFVVDTPVGSFHFAIPVSASLGNVTVNDAVFN